MSSSGSTSLRKRIVCFGELLLRLSSPGRERLFQSPRLDAHFGGAEGNVAVSLARFGNEASMVSIVPHSALGDAALAELKKHGVDVSSALRRAGRLGTYYLELGAGLRAGEVLYDRSGSAFAIAPPDAIDWKAALTGARWLHLSGVTPAIGQGAAAAAVRAAAAAAQLHVDVSFDGNFRERLWAQWSGDPRAILGELVGHARIAFINDKDVALVLGRSFAESDVADRLRAAARAAFAAFPQLESIYTLVRDVRDASTQELRGRLFRRDHEFVTRTHSLHEIVDRIGSGDAFVAGVLHGIVAGYDDQETLEFGAAAAALKHSIPGDFNLVGVEDVQRLVRSTKGDLRR
jgi:2-dehydro-3-deoxygluconokinase